MGNLDHTQRPGPNWLAMEQDIISIHGKAPDYIRSMLPPLKTMLENFRAGNDSPPVDWEAWKQRRTLQQQEPTERDRAEDMLLAASLAKLDQKLMEMREREAANRAKRERLWTESGGNGQSSG